MLTTARLLRLSLPLLCLGLPFWLVFDNTGPSLFSDGPAARPTPGGILLAFKAVGIAFVLGTLMFLSVAWRERKDFFSGWFAFVEIFMGMVAGLPGMALANGATTFMRAKTSDSAALLLMSALWPLIGWASGFPSDRFLLGLALGWFNFWGLALILQARPGFLWVTEEPPT